MKTLLTVNFWGIILFLVACEQAYPPTQTVARHTVAVTDSSLFKDSGFGIASPQRERDIEAAFAAKNHFSHAFGSFYIKPDSNWVLVHYKFGISEGEHNFFMSTPCPPLDSNTFQELAGNYWKDKHGVYYAALSNYTPHIITVQQVDLATFKDLGFEHLAVDTTHVYQRGTVLPGMAPAILQVYTPQGQREENWDFNSDSYLLSDDVGYGPDGKLLSSSKTRHFKPSTGYKLAYSGRKRYRPNHP